MKYSIRKNWIASIDMMMENSVLLMPFVLISFFELLALELIYFSTRPPLSVIAAPVIRKFFGEAFLHYPANLAITPNLFYYAQIAVYIFIGVLLTATAVNIFKNIKEKLPVMANAMVRNASKRYGAFMVYGIIIMILVAAIKPLDTFVFTKAFHLAQRLMPGIPTRLGGIGFTLFLFLTNFFIQVIFIASVPFMVLEKKPLFKAIFSSMTLFAGNFFTMLILIGLPFLVYLPIVVLKSLAGALVGATFPEIILAITVLGGVTSIFVDCFAIVCVSQFIMDISKSRGRKA